MANKKILVVEDHDLLSRAIRDVLMNEGYEVVNASDGVDGLEKLGQLLPDLIIADINMPRMNGYRFFEEVHANPNWVPIPFIFLTARAEREDRLKGKAMGAEDYIIKPFDSDELLVVVKSRIGRAEAIREVAESEFEDLKKQIITLLSHELRTPLTSVYGYTELALEEAAELPATDFTVFLNGIKKGADRLYRLVQDLLTVVRLDTGDLEREFELLATHTNQFDQLIEQAVTLCKSQSQRMGVEVKVTIEHDLPVVLLHAEYLTQALERLLDNAIKFSRRDIKVVNVHAYREPEGLIIDVQDHGVGIRPEALAALFHRFHQIDRSTMEQQGTGMGLVISQALIRCMNGEITVKSEPETGSVFSIHLPEVTD